MKCAVPGEHQEVLRGLGFTVSGLGKFGAHAERVVRFRKWHVHNIGVGRVS